MTFEQCKYINKVMSGFNKKWFFAGGWAIDLFLRKETRDHHDIEIGIFREDQIKLKQFLSTWNFKKVFKGKFISWDDEYLELPIHEILATNHANDYELEILLNECDAENWKFRRDLKISYPLQSVIMHSETGIPYLASEIVLLYKVIKMIFINDISLYFTWDKMEKLFKKTGGLTVYHVLRSQESDKVLLQFGFILK